MKKNIKPKLMVIFEILLKKFGPQNWWPGESREEIIIGAILTQNTNWKNVEKSIINLKLNNLIDFSHLAEIDEEKLAEFIHSSGYYNQKARKLKMVTDFFVSHPFSILDSIPTCEFRKDLVAIAGIGPETADSILLYAFNRPIFVVDAYTKRIFNRLGLLGKNISYTDAQTFFMRNLPADVKLFNEYHALLVKLGKEYCKKIPKCSQCPLEIICSHQKMSVNK